MLEPLQETENWVALAFLLFLGLLAYLGVHRKLMDSLDARQGRIKSELDEARRLREEAERLVADYKARQQAAGAEAEAIVAHAKAEAERIVRTPTSPKSHPISSPFHHHHRASILTL